RRAPVKIAIAAHGRFHAFHLARALLERGHDVTLLTNYPRWAVQRFGFPRDRVRSYLAHGAFVRLSSSARRLGVSVAFVERALHRSFGRWTARQLRGAGFDVAYLFSGIAEEALTELQDQPRTLRLVVRGSSHIREQARLLEEEEGRTGWALER